MTLTLNTKSGRLHRYPRCAGGDTRFHYTFTLDRHGIGEELIGFYGLAFRGLCRRCLEDPLEVAA